MIGTTIVQWTAPESAFSVTGPGGIEPLQTTEFAGMIGGFGLQFAMEPDRTLTICTLKALVILCETEEEWLHAILDDDAEDTETREAAMKELATVLRNHHTLLASQLAELEAAR